MEQVRELLGLIKGVKANGGLVATSFVVRRVQPYKERAHAAFDFKGETDGTRERTDVTEPPNLYKIKYGCPR